MISVAVVLDIGLTMGLIFAPAVMAMMLSLRCLDFPDLTIEASLPLGGAVTAVALSGGLSSVGSLLLGALAGAVAGTMTATIHDKLKLSKLLAGIIVLTMFYSVMLRVMRGSNISLLGQKTLLDYVAGWDTSLEGMSVLSRFHLGRNALLLLITLLVWCGLLVFLRSLPGLRLQAAGSNSSFAQGMGIGVSGYVVGGLAAANFLAGLSGGILAMHQGFADVGMGQGVLVISIASLAMGERILVVGRRWTRAPYLLSAAIIGSFVYQVLIVLALRLGLAASDLKLATAALVLAVMAVQYGRGAGLVPSRGY